MAEIKTLTSMNRNGVAVANGSKIDVPQDDAVALCRNGLAEPIGWALEPIAEDGSDIPKPDDGSGAAAKVKGKAKG